MSRVRTRPATENRIRCSFCAALIKEKFLEGHQSGCSKNPARDASLPVRERRAK